MHTEATKSKISESLKVYHAKNPVGQDFVKNHRKVMEKASGLKIKQLTIHGELIATFSCIREAARQTGIPRSSIGNCVVGYAEHARGFVFRKF
jgi:hypothetical protein